ncbi:unnamed protein product [Eruca vesicaria subsp. sativa]|uniref:FBD domain-containing protein n=1 Tax=Eruca vesicaria subsp. sativa TaxID=29727 RepID=A0ABC8KIM8_ERUVS|nr:unnamed protein product [Eruca vesicaria subsp. sativa]
MLDPTATIVVDRAGGRKWGGYYILLNSQTLTLSRVLLHAYPRSKLILDENANKLEWYGAYKKEHSKEMKKIDFSSYLPECFLSSLKFVDIKTGISGDAGEMKLVSPREIDSAFGLFCKSKCNLEETPEYPKTLYHMSSRHGSN